MDTTPPTPPIPPTRPADPHPGPAAEPAVDSTAETRRLLAEAKAAFAAEQAAADAEEAAAGPSLLSRGKKLAEDVRDDPVQAVTDRLDDRLGDHKKAVALGLIAAGAVVLLQSRWVRRKAIPVVASAGTAYLQTKARDWFRGGGDDAPSPKIKTPRPKPRRGDAVKPPVDERPRTVDEALDEPAAS
ncbi:hypothetical protein [Phycisphaera mikurensis]|uniref:DUF3618 domain-containing protein n=1 Tax=Phycisphaera mikurensis (strain NBRC 102666 / KCTC 22515 / FYK2301M01) TaxID=1142394 RepID=I0IDF1_PHYMF|nr:hypothetical protein [Phycisphaera mikurensis]MBB6443325.1 hypothetical protein [Phycisphaera mikurensis]BAM03289.1 hypothetical protein PSMK_11300 [Phycisphaera mikurensis NBRC 102666]